MKANKWPLEYAQNPDQKKTSLFGSLSDDREQVKGDWLLLIKSDYLIKSQDIAIFESFLLALQREELPPAALIFLRDGVKLTCKASPFLDHLLALEQRNIQIFTSGACLAVFGLGRELCVGKMISMNSLVSMISNTLRVVTL